MKSLLQNVEKSKVNFDSTSTNNSKSSSISDEEPLKEVQSPKPNLIEKPETSKTKYVKSKSKKNQLTSEPTVIQKRPKAKGHKVGILHYNYPDELLDNEQLTLLQEAILKNVEKQADEIIKPKFHNLNLQAGWLLITCADRNTVEWLKGLSNRLKPWSDGNLMIVEEKDIPNGQIFIVKFPRSSDTNEQILRFLKAQNEGLNTEDWKVHNRTQTRKRINITFVVDQNSATQLNECNYKISYKFGVVYFRPKKISNLARFKIQQAYNNKPISPEIWLEKESLGLSTKENNN